MSLSNICPRCNRYKLIKDYDEWWCIGCGNVTLPLTPSRKEFLINEATRSYRFESPRYSLSEKKLINLFNKFPEINTLEKGHFYKLPDATFTVYVHKCPEYGYLLISNIYLNIEGDILYICPLCAWGMDKDGKSNQYQPENI